ncbi:hypothetical protein [Pseudomonas anguilliseptica]|uniref:hypothetical protein n=1 Tax=Pseudomonas anguilliseptica TaxID=53406 RepID=UPI00325BA8E0
MLNKSVFSIKLTARRSLSVYLEELERFASYNTEKKDDYLFVAAAVRILTQYMVQQQEQGLADVAQRTFRSYLTFKPLTRKQGKAINKLRDFIGFTGRRQKLSATPDLSDTVLPLCLIPNSALKSAPLFKSVMPKALACARLPT